MLHLEPINTPSEHEAAVFTLSAPLEFAAQHIPLEEDKTGKFRRLLFDDFEANLLSDEDFTFAQVQRAFDLDQSFLEHADLEYLQHLAALTHAGAGCALRRGKNISVLSIVSLIELNEAAQEAIHITDLRFLQDFGNFAKRERAQPATRAQNSADEFLRAVLPRFVNTSIIDM